MKVSRRSFVKAATSALLIPTLTFRPFKERHIDLSLFCDTDHWWARQYDMRNPFQQEGVTYATDARVAIRTSLITAPDDAEDCKRPPVSALPWWDHGLVSHWKPLRLARRTTRESGYKCICPTCDCKGRCGQGVIPCPICEGDGIKYDHIHDSEIICDCRHGFIGGRLCDECGGSGEVDYAVDLGDLKVAPSYCKKLLTLGEVDYAVPTAIDYDKKGHPMTPLMVRFDGGDGLLMPVNP